MKLQSTVLLVALVSLISLGCEKKPMGEPVPADGGATPAASAAPEAGGTGGVTPMAGVGAGPMTPVAGAESVQGGGSAAGQVLKDKAKDVAGTAPSSLNQMGGDE